MILSHGFRNLKAYCATASPPLSWLYKIIVVSSLFRVMFHFHSGGSTRILDAITKSLDTGDSCSIALDYQAAMLKAEYKKLLSEITHIAIIGYPDHS
jgi:hypothetical protein